jgi:hypothetical protein
VNDTTNKPPKQEKCYDCNGTGLVRHECNPSPEPMHPASIRCELESKKWCGGTFPGLAHCRCGAWYIRQYQINWDDSMDLPDDVFVGMSRPPDEFDIEGFKK